MNDPAAPSPSHAGIPRADLLAASACMMVSLLLAVAPHLTMLVTTGNPGYLADSDDTLYLAIGRIPYFGESRLFDPFSSRSEKVPSLFTWLQFVPMASLTRALGLRPELMALVWRAFGGLLMGPSLYFLFRR